MAVPANGFHCVANGRSFTPIPIRSTVPTIQRRAKKRSIRPVSAKGVVFFCALLLVTVATHLYPPAANATIMQGDVSIWGTFQSRWSGRWGEGSAHPESLGEGGGSFDFNRWDLVQARQKADIRVSYQLVSNYKLLGRLDTWFIKDANFFGQYRPWYDAFPDIKSRGRAETFRDWRNFTHDEKKQEFQRNDFREYHADLGITNDLSFRVGKQQVIWTEADALSGTEVTNPSDLRFHWNNFESPEDLRRNLRMIKINYTFPNFFKTASNQFEAFVIPGDWEGGASLVTSDARNPWVAFVPLTPLPGFNQEGVPVRAQTLADQPALPMFPLGSNEFVDLATVTNRQGLSNSIKNSEFGTRMSSLLPIGNGLQISLLYFYEARFDKLGFCENCPNPNKANFVKVGPGQFFSAPGLGVTPVFAFGPARPGLTARGGAKVGTFLSVLNDEWVRQHFLGVTGTYYDSDLTNIVFRFDFAYRPKVAVALDGGAGVGPTPAQGSGARWTQQSIFILAGDRPTYIHWLSKQHTFLTAQHTVFWYPALPKNAVPFFGNFAGKQRGVQNLSFVAATNWLLNGQLTTSHAFFWDWDNNTGEYYATNVFRYSQHVLVAFNVAWFLGASGRFTDPFVFSRGQRMNELEAVFTYEI